MGALAVVLAWVMFEDAPWRASAAHVFLWLLAVTIGASYLLTARPGESDVAQAPQRRVGVTRLAALVMALVAALVTLVEGISPLQARGVYPGAVGLAVLGALPALAVVSGAVVARRGWRTPTGLLVVVPVACVVIYCYFVFKQGMVF